MHLLGELAEHENPVAPRYTSWRSESIENALLMTYQRPVIERRRIVGQMAITQSECAAPGGEYSELPGKDPICRSVDV